MRRSSSSPNPRRRAPRSRSIPRRCSIRRVRSTLGNPQGDVTFVEFFDYNCGYCKRALTDMMELMSKDAKLKVVLKEFPVLGSEFGRGRAGRGRGAHAGQDRQEISRISPEAADRPRPGRQGEGDGRRQGDRPRHGAAREGPQERRDRQDAGGEHEARRGARPQRHAELRDRQRRRDRRGRAWRRSARRSRPRASSKPAWPRRSTS